MNCIAGATESVSIVTPSYNCQDFIAATYESLKRQTHNHWEWLVADDCSTDGTFELLTRLAAADSRIRLVRFNKNLGPANARNWGLENADGDFVAFLDADDLWLPSKLSSQVAFMNQDQKSFTFTSYGQLDRYGHKLPTVVDSRSIDVVDYQDLLRKRATVGCSTVMLRRSAVPSGLKFPDIRSGQDYAFWLSILRTGQVAHRLGELLTYYRILPGSVSRNKFKKAARQWQIYREIEHLNIYSSIVCFGYYAWNAVVRK